LDSRENKNKTLKIKKLYKKVEKLLEINHAAFIAFPNQENGLVELRLMDLDDAKDFETKLKNSFQEQMQDLILSKGDTISVPKENKPNGKEKKDKKDSQNGYQESQEG
jgi:hypothetical protein